MFQGAQKSAAQKEKEQVNKAREKAFGEPFLGSYKKDQQLIELQDSGAARQQQQMQEEIDLRALEEQEQNIRQLEVSCFVFFFVSCVDKKLLWSSLFLV